ncbi:TolB family protein [Rubrolithibacter danxiaensis]|uniref:TolB family protein n=1 Tax=Rubrolithibacter danxiaensis TaxID=3390805 RepID=UPI003BF7AB5B
MTFPSKNFTFKKLIISLFILITLIFNIHSTSAQVFDAEQNPPGIEWEQITIPSFQIIYPSALRDEAQRMANTLEILIQRVSFSLNIRPKKISVILQNQGTTSNGFVQLAPRRSEFFTTPSQEFDYQDWLNSLAVHELRHVVQFDKLTGNLNAPLFEELAFAIFGITLPPWFYEGDAVGIETALTSAGRGRLPEWELTFRTNTLSKKEYSYSKNYLGSVRDLTPGYYQLGYFLTTKLRRDYGNGILDSIYRRMKRAPLRPYNLSNSIKKFTGLSTRNLHDSTVAELKNLWAEQLKKVNAKDYPILNVKRKSQPEFYLLPTPSSKQGELIFLKQNRLKTSAISVIDSNGNERTLVRIGIQEIPNFSYANNKIVWDEFRYDARFHKRSFNVINVYDISTHSYHQLTHKTRLFAPALSPDGKTIAAIDVNYSNQVFLVELDAENGSELRRYPSPANTMLQTPAFNPEGNKIVLVGVNQQGKTLLEFDREQKAFHQLIPFQKQLISKPAYAEGQLIFKAHYNGIDNIYRLSTDGKIYQIISARFGAYNPTYDSKTQKIYFNNYHVNGYDISSIPWNAQAGTLTDSLENTSINYIGPVAKQEGHADVFSTIAEKKYPSKPYLERYNLFYFHSLIPIAESNTYGNNNYGLKLQSDNKLNTLSFYAGYQFNNTLKKSEYLTGFTYRRYFPVFDISYKNLAQQNFLKVVSEEETKFIPYSWRENVFKAEITIPVIFNQLNHNFAAGFTSGTSYTARYNVVNRPANFNETLIFPLHYEVYFNHNVRQSVKDLAPRWGQNVRLTYHHFPFEEDVKGELLTLRTVLYFPGIAPSHSFQASFNYQNASRYYNTTVDIPRVRGYNYLRNREKLNNTLLLDYKFPLFYPDWTLGPIAYIKRIKAGFFTDFENIRFHHSFSPQTFGAELSADMNLLRFYLPNFDIGGKIIFINKKPQQNPIFETSISYSF